jgi:hypothetical protein
MAIKANLKTAPATAIQALLEPGENILWIGQPQQGLMLRASDGFTIPFSLLWCGFAIFWEFMALEHGAPGFFDAWGIPFVLIGLYMVFGRFFFDAFQRARTNYAVTDQRVLIATQGFTTSVRTLAIEGLTDINVSLKPNGRGTLKFGRDVSPYGSFAFRGWPGAGSMAPAFEGIDNAIDVLHIIRDARKASGS